MEEDIKRTSGYAAANNKDLIIAELSFKLGKYEEKIKEDESVIHEMAKELNAGVLKKEDWCNLKNCIGDSTCLKCLKEYFRNKAKGEKR